MSAVTASNNNHDAETNDSSIPEGPKKGLGNATRNGPMLTPEATPEPENARTEADRRRREQEQKSADIENKDNTDAGSTSPSDEDVIQRILKCGKDDHREVLGISESYETPYKERAAIERATWKLGTDTHPDYNKHKEAQQAFERVIKAAEALNCKEDWIKEVKEWDGAGSDGDSDSDTDEMEAEYEVPAITPKTVKMYQEATAHIAHLQKKPKSKTASKQLEAINNRIKEMNGIDGVEPIDQWTIDYRGLAEYYSEALPFIRKIKKNPDDVEAKQKVDEINQKLDEFIKKRKYLDWRVHPEVVLSEEAEAAKPTPKKNTEKPAPTNEPAKPTPTNEPATPIPNKEPAAAKTNEANASSKTAAEWRPGLTEKGERILAMAPTETEDVLGNPVMTRCSFLVEKKGQENPIAFEDAADIGEQASKGYLQDLPEAERVDIRSKKNNYSPKDRKGFVQMKGVAYKESTSANRFPVCAVWIEYEDGSSKFVNRSGCRAIWKSKADRMIEDVFIDKQLEIPWEKRAKRPNQAKVPPKHPAKARNLRSEDAPWRTQSPRRGRSFGSPERGRSRSTSSSASYLSDEGLERLDGIEERMSKFEQMFMKMDKKLDAMNKTSK
ncbi:unnamed protein product [Periconia digitata]|uniref:J domain-containing protein n=1 Tax=Periconia digitata TaxID=1303443 RepID=A0A9W4UU08_9PLEO|nr:unnamed protein product [Periconia digitata]